MTGGSWRLTTAIQARGVNAFTGAITPPKVSEAGNAIQSLGFGTGSARMDSLVAISQSLAPGASVTFNLFDGSLLDITGMSATFRVLKGFAAWVVSGGDSAGVTLGQAGSNPTSMFWVGTTPGEVIYPGGPAISNGSPAGVLVTSTTCNLQVLNNGAVAATFALYLAGSTAVSGSPIGFSNLLLTYA